jgi:hypothetical protein
MFRPLLPIPAISSHPRTILPNSITRYAPGIPASYGFSTRYCRAHPPVICCHLPGFAHRPGILLLRAPLRCARGLRRKEWFVFFHIPALTPSARERASGTYWAKFTTRLAALSIGLFLVHLAQCPSPSVKHTSQIQRKPARRSAFPISYSDSPRVLQISGRLSSPASTCRCANFLCCCPFDFAQGLRLRPQARTRGSPTPAGAREVVFLFSLPAPTTSARERASGTYFVSPFGLSLGSKPRPASVRA